MDVVIVGGGFGGVKAAIELSKKNLGTITLISDEDYFLHHATLYATATGRSEAESVVPLEEIFKYHPSVKVVKDRIKAIDPERRLVSGKVKSYKYDKLVMAIGWVTTYFGIDGMDKHSFGIKTLKEVEQFSKHIHKDLLRDNHEQKNYVVIGGGATGVELAGALAEYLERVRQAHLLKRSNFKIILVEAASKILPRMSDAASSKITAKLRSLGVEVIVGKKVEALDDDFILIDGKKVPTHTAVWTSGVTNHPFFAQHRDLFKIAANGRVEVNQYLEAYRDIYVIGDNADTKYCGVARNALDDASYLARHLARLVTHRPLIARKPTQPPSGLPIGDSWAYVEWRGVAVAGKFGAYLRRQIELSGYLQLLPMRPAKAAWRAHNRPADNCAMCAKQPL